MTLEIGENEIHPTYLEDRPQDQHTEKKQEFMHVLDQSVLQI